MTTVPNKRAVKKAAKIAAKAAPRRLHDPFPRRLQNFIPPEGVPIHFDIATLGSRFGAQLLDIILTYGALLIVLLTVLWTGALDWNAFQTLFALLAFLVRIPYYVLSELIWNGRTLGKRITRIRVISADGRRLTPHQVTARNLMKEVEIFTPFGLLITQMGEDWVMLAITWIWVILVIAVPLRHKRRQRMGDIVAGTLVVDIPRASLLPDLAAHSTEISRKFTFLPVHLDIYGRYELQALETILREPPKTTKGIEERNRIVDTIIRKISYAEPVAAHEAADFLLAFYRAQREHLESRNLFGDQRQDKFHSKTRG